LGFIKAVSLQLTLVSSGPFGYGPNQVALPDPEIVEALESLGIQVELTNVHDGACPEPDRVGVEDAAPGGCDSIVVEAGS